MSAGVTDDLKREEEFRAVPYDDATGETFGRSDVLRGNLTNGYGWAMALRPLTEAQASIILSWHIDDVAKDLGAKLPWLNGLDDLRYRAVLNMAYNVGVTGLLKFTHMLAALQKADYATAAREIRNSRWPQQVGARAERVAKLIEGIDSYALS